MEGTYPMIEVTIQLSEVTHRELLSYANKVHKPVDQVILDFVEAKLRDSSGDDWSNRLDIVLENMRRDARAAGLTPENVEEAVRGVVGAVRKGRARGGKAKPR